MTNATLIKLLTTRFGDYKKNGNEVQVCCPFCILRRPEAGADTRYKLYINIEKKVYNCFRCEIKGRLVNLIPQLEVISEEAQKIHENIDAKETKLEPYPVFQYFGSLHYPWNELVDELLKYKGFTVDELWSKVHFCEDYRKGEYVYGPCLLFPIYHFGIYRGFQARTIYRNRIPKYIGASNMDRRSMLYNYDVAFGQSKRLVITEGFFDSIRVGDTAVATLGKSITPLQIRLIRLGEFDKVIVFLDKDAEREMRATAKQLALYFKTFICLPKWHLLPLKLDGEKKKDPGDLTIEEKEYCLKNNLERIY